MFPYEPIDVMQEANLGPWSTEPNSAEWQAYGLECCIIRAPNLGSLCGYAGVPKSHPLYRRESSLYIYRKVENSLNYVVGFGFVGEPEYQDIGLDVHGGVTFVQASAHNDLWWFGFDCAHSNDLTPFKRNKYSLSFQTYRDFVYVTEQTNSLAKQLSEFPNNFFETL
jgi:hypothetical protein